VKRHQAKMPSSIWVAPPTSAARPDALLHVKLIEPEKEAGPLNSWVILLIAAAIVLGIILLILWGTYVCPRTYPQPVSVSQLSVALVSPAYVAIGDEAYLDVTVTNTGTTPITGTVAVVFEGSATAHPVPAQKTVINVDDLAGGASVTQRMGFFIYQTPIFFCQDTVRLSLQVTVDNQCKRVPIRSQISVAPIPHVKEFVSLLSGSAITTAVVTLLWDEMKKRLFGAKGR
jgi:hypothetical protein